jgi:hypothetical protein
MSQDLLVGEAEDGPAKRLKLGLPQLIPQDDLVETMNAAVDFKDQSEPVAGEVGEEAAYRVLSAKPVAVDLATPNASPEAVFGQTGAPALGAGEGCAGAGHMARLILPPRR